MRTQEPFFIFLPKRLPFRAKPIDLIGFPNGSGIRLLGEKYMGLNESQLDELVPPQAILDLPRMESAIAVRQLVIRKGVEKGANFILSDTFGARHITDAEVYHRVVDGQVSIVRSTLENLAQEGLLPDPEAFNGGAWFGPFGDCYKFEPQENDFDDMFRLHLQQAKAAERNKVEPQFEAVSSVRQAQAIAQACKEHGITSPSINFVVDQVGNLAADKTSFRNAIAAVHDILPQAKIGLNCCRVEGAQNSILHEGNYGSFYPNASQLKDAWELEGAEGSHNDINEKLANDIVSFAHEKGFTRVGICCGADEESLGLIADANKRKIDEALAKRKL